MNPRAAQTLVLLVGFAGCSFDFAAAPADASNERDQGSRDASVAGPVVLEAGPDGAPEIVFEPSGQCGTTEAKVASGGGSCADGILISSLSARKEQVWELSCAGDKTSEAVVCVSPPSATKVSAGEVAGSTWSCEDSGRVIGGGCNCGSQKLRESYPAGDDTWSCACEGGPVVLTMAFCLRGVDADAWDVKRVDSKPTDGEISVGCEQGRLIGGGCDASGPLLINRPVVTSSGVGSWRCQTTAGATVTAHAICID